jgi:hypothetical protein
VGFDSGLAFGETLIGQVCVSRRVVFLMRKIALARTKGSLARTWLIAVFLLACPVASSAQCSNPPSGFGPAWARQYAAWCRQNGGQYDSNGPKCVPGPNWCGRQGAQGSAAAPDTSEADAYVEQHRRAAEEQQRQQREEELQREQAAEAERNREFEKNKEEALSDIKDVTDVKAGVKAIPPSVDLGLKHVGDAGPAAWDHNFTNPQIAKIAKGLDSIHIPPPLPQKEASLTWQQMAGSAWKGIESGEHVAFLTWDLLGKFGDAAPLHVKVVLIAGKALLDGEDAAYLHLVKRDEVYESALHYLKSPATARQFAEIVRDLKEKGHASESADPAMVRAARAITDPALGSSGTRMAFDAMMSREAVAAMARKVCLEAGAEMVGEGTQGLLADLTKRKELYEAVRVERNAARAMLKQTTVPAEQEQLKLVISHANKTLANIYRLERAGPVIAGDLAAEHLKNDVEAATGAHSPEK